MKLKDVLNLIRSLQRLRQLVASKRAAKQHQQVLQKLEESLGSLAALNAPAIVILMPGALHIGRLALHRLGQHPSVVVIANGLAPLELAEVAGFKAAARISIETTLQHFEIIDALIQKLDQPFWLIDHDCYILNEKILQEWPEIVADRVGVAVFCRDDAITKFLTLETFLLLLNPRVIRRIEDRYQVTSRTYRWEELPAAAKKQLESRGCRADRLAEGHKPYFDTLRVLGMLAEAEGCGFDLSRGYAAVCRPYPDVIHIGATSNPSWVIEPFFYSALGAFFWRLCLEYYPSANLREVYNKRVPHLPPLDDMRQQLLGAGCAVELISFLERLVREGYATGSKSV